MWACPKCKRQFTRKNQRHACGTGERTEVLRNRPPELVELYAQLKEFVKSLGPMEFVTRERYVLMRSKRIFADLTVYDRRLEACDSSIAKGEAPAIVQDFRTPARTR